MLAVIIISQLIAAFMIKHMPIVRVEGDKARISDSLARESHVVNKRQMVKTLKTRKTTSHTAVELKTGEKLTQIRDRIPGCFLMENFLYICLYSSL